ncbi:UNVERIFIED_CONTAM: hypothetical protein FKN15_049158 [Acipenser sinensis]
MDEELLLAPSSFRNPMSTTMRMYRRDLGKLQRDMKSTDLGLGFGARGETKYGAYTAENEHSLIHTGENLSRSRRILRSMSRRLMTNKLLLSVIIIMELAILGAVVYLKFFRK